MISEQKALSTIMVTSSQLVSIVAPSIVAVVPIGLSLSLLNSMEKII